MNPEDHAISWRKGTKPLTGTWVCTCGQTYPNNGSRYDGMYAGFALDHLVQHGLAAAKAGAK